MGTFLFIFGLIMIIIGFLTLLIKKNPKDGYKILIVFLLAIGGYLYGIGVAIRSDKVIKLSENTFKTEVRLEYTNGQEISRDTIYIFTPKK